MGEYADLPGHLDQEEEQEEEEALSLCNLPLEEEEEVDDDDSYKEISNHVSSIHSRRSSSESPEFFEFFSDLSSEMCSAEDVIFCGKLIPFKDIKTITTSTATHSHHQQQDKRHISFRRRSESLSGLHTSIPRSNSINTTKLMMRNSRSLDYSKLERFSTSKTSPDSDNNTMVRNPSVRSIGRGDGMVKKMAAKPRWYVLMFGVVKPPAEMELRDIKSRQVRRNSFPPPVADTVKKPQISKSSCKLLKVLSCRDHASVAVTTSFYMPRGHFHGQSCPQK